MSVYAVVVTTALTLLALLDAAAAAMWTAVGLFAIAALLFGEFLRLRRHGRADGRPSVPHRLTLDRLVLIQWLGSSVTAFVLSSVLSSLDVAPIESAGRLVHALIVGVVIGSLGVFISSLVDWYVILPKVSGFAGPAPCECAGGTRWKYTTCDWYFHRAAATAIVYVVVTGIPAYMAGTSTGSASLTWTLIAAGIAAVGGYFFRGMFLAGWYAFRPPILVGDQIYVEVAGEGEGDVTMHRHRAYVVDVSLQGVGYKILDNGQYVRGRFVDKHDGNVPNHKLPGLKAPTSTKPLCPQGHCSGVNWYCRHNPDAYS